ncbi:MAG: hypothetical protein N4A47_01655 [Clostridia bacterium]|jgi:hypothetical protein|nr:hypothetical protein [Clostridia bacterium]
MSTDQRKEDALRRTIAFGEVLAQMRNSSSKAKTAEAAMENAIDTFVKINKTKEQKIDVTEKKVEVRTYGQLI